MIARIITGSLARPLLVVVVAIAASIAGAFAFQGLRRDVFPDLSAPIFNVIVQNATMSAEDLETAIAIPLEAALAGLPDVRRIRSTSQLGVSQVTIEFDADADYYRSRQFVAERMAQASAQLPPGTEPPVLSSLTGRLNEVLEFTLEADPGAADLMTLRDLAEFDIRNRLLAVPGVASVERLGGYLRQFQVQLDPERMVARGIGLSEVIHALDEANENAGGGFVVQGPVEWTVRAVGRIGTVDDLRATVIALKGTVPVLVGDVADVREAPAVRRGVAHRLKGEVVSCRISKQFGADTVEVADAVRAALAEVERTLPEGVHLRLVYDQSALVRSALGGVGRAVLLGAAFVVVVLLVLLGDWRAALLVTLTIPLSVLVAGTMLGRWQVGLNTMTLGGIAIAVGLLVDASIIVIENVLHRLHDVPRGASRREVVRAAAIEVGPSIAFATAIVMAVFVPLFSMSGIEGRMYAPLAATVVATLLASLVLALTLVPVLAGWVLRPSRRHDQDTRLVAAVKRRYAPLLAWSLARSRTVVAVCAVITLPALVAATRVGSDFMPELDEGAYLLQTQLPAEASLAEVDRLNHRVEDVLRTFPEVEDVVRRTGRAERTEDPMPHTLSDVLVILTPDGGRRGDALEEAMRDAVTRVPGISVLFTTPLGMRIDEGLGGTPADLAVRIFGPDLDQLVAFGERAERIVRGVRGVADVRTEQLTGLPQVRIVVDRQAAARAGLAPGDVVDAVRIGLVGQAFSDVWLGQRRYDLVLKLQDDRRSDPAALPGLLVDGHDGVRLPLSKLAAIEQVFSPGSIRREGGSRRIAVEATVAGRDLGSTATEVREHLARELRLPPGYFFDIGGRVENQVRAIRGLVIATGFAAVAVFVLLYLALDGLRDTLVVLLTLPVAAVGAVLALIAAGATWNVSSLVGLIGLLGIAVQNGLVLVTQTRQLVASGLPFAEAVREASIGRVRPKLMTAGTAMLGLLPILVLPLHGTEIERPLAIVMTGGLVTSTLFTLLALPTVYLIAHGGWARRSA